MVRIENWKVVDTDSNPYTAPECMVLRLCGNVYGHPDRTDGESITTSVIEGVEGRVVKCFSRSYELGSPDPNYVEWCKKNNVHVPTEEEPIRYKIVTE